MKFIVCSVLLSLFVLEVCGVATEEKGNQDLANLSHDRIIQEREKQDPKTAKLDVAVKHLSPEVHVGVPVNSTNVTGDVNHNKTKSHSDILSNASNMTVVGAESALDVGFPIEPVTDKGNTTTVIPTSITTVIPTNSTTVSPNTTTAPTSTTSKSTTTSPTPTTSTATPTTIAPNSTTPSPVTSTHPTPTSTAAPSKSDRKFDGLSFFAGIVLSAGLLAIGVVAYKFYEARRERNYHTL